MNKFRLTKKQKKYWKGIHKRQIYHSIAFSWMEFEGIKG